jgi:CRP/FNR family transcriptional regulator, cyclic AMP receptor protein
VVGHDERRSASQPQTATRAPGAPTVAAARGDQGHIATFAQVSLFSTLDPEGLRELAAAARRRAYRAGEVIFHRDDPGQVLYVIREGKVKICINSPDGHEVVLAVFSPGDYFGELALLDGQPRSASAVAIDSVEVYALQRSDFIKIVIHHPHIAIQVMNVLSRRLRQTDAMIEDLLFLDVHGRVAKKLLDLAELHGIRTADGVRIDMKLTQSDLAALVGASRESVNKVLGYFVDKRFISSEKRKITILRLAELRRRIC